MTSVSRSTPADGPAFAETAVPHTAEKQARALCDRAFIRQLTAIRGGRSVLATSLIWAQLVVAWTAALIGPPMLWLPAFVINCACVSAMQLWVHESSHYMLFRSRRFNDFWATLFFASPIGMSLATYRRYHMSHHRYLSTPEDLDRFAFDVDVHGPRGLAGLLVRGLLGIDGARLVLRKYLSRDTAAAAPRDWSMLATLGWHALLLTACVLAGRWYLYFALWVYPILGVAVTINSLRTVGEHQPEGFDLPAGAEQDIPAITRTTLPGPLEKWLMFQSNFNYHFEHHLYPTIPAVNLPELHRHLVAKGFYRQHPDLLQSSAVARVFRLSRDPHAEAPAA